MDKIPDEILYITPDITGLTKLGRIPFHKGNTDPVGDQFDQIGLSNTGGSDHDDIVLDSPHLFLGLPLRGFLKFDPVEMGAHLGGQNLFGLLLFDDKLIQVSLQLFRFQVEMGGRCLFICLGLMVLPRLVSIGSRKKHGNHQLDPIAILLAQILVELLLKLLLIRNFCIFGLIVSHGPFYPHEISDQYNPFPVGFQGRGPAPSVHARGDPSPTFSR